MGLDKHKGHPRDSVVKWLHVTTLPLLLPGKAACPFHKNKRYLLIFLFLELVVVTAQFVLLRKWYTGKLPDTRMFVLICLPEQDPQVGGEGMLGAGLSSEQLKRLQRFDPCVVPSQDSDTGSLRDARIEDTMWLANKDCIGFFIAKFVKCKST